MSSELKNRLVRYDWGLAVVNKKYGEHTRLLKHPKGGYIKQLKNLEGQWFTPGLFMYIPTLKDVKRYYDII